MYTKINIYRQTPVCPHDHKTDPRAQSMRLSPVLPKKRVATHGILSLDPHCKGAIRFRAAVRTNIHSFSAP